MNTKEIHFITMYHEIHRLRYVEHFSIQRIANHLSINFRTVKNYLDMSPEDFEHYLDSKKRRSSLLDPYREFISGYLNKNEDAPASVVHDRLKEHYPTFPVVDPKTVYNYVWRLRNELNIPFVSRCERQYSPVPDVEPGSLAQVDFGEKKLRRSTGEWVKTYFFVMLLCYSRYKYIHFRTRAFDAQSAAEAHERAFEFFRGVPREILYDQDSVFLHRENNGDYIMTDVFERYTASRPFEVTFCRAADPESKGKVENAVRYVKGNFLFQRTFIDDAILNTQAMAWLERTGNAMVHGTTRKIPVQEWAREQPLMYKWVPLFIDPKPSGYKVLKTNVLKYKGNSYSLPFGTYKNDETKVYPSQDGELLVIKDETGAILASHQMPAGVGNNVVNTNHRRDTSVKLQELRDKVKTFFHHSPDIEAFVSNVDRLYPRYVRDQLTTLLVCSEKAGEPDAEIALEFCVRNALFSANDVKAILDAKKPKSRRKEEGVVKPLGDAKTQLIVTMEPDKSDIDTYEALFTPKTTSHEPAHAQY
jgi:transposase